MAAEQSLRVGLNLGTLRGLGSSQVGRCVLAALAARPDPHRYVCWVPQQWAAADVPPHDRRMEPIRVKAGLFSKLLTDQVVIRRAARRGRIDVLFSLNDTSIVRSPVPHLLLVHQPHLALDLGAAPYAMSGRARQKFILMQTNLRLCLPSVSLLTVQTRFMQERMIERWGLPTERVAVIPSAIESIPGTLGTWRGDADPPFLLYPASANPHKNHVVLADMMRTVADRSLPARCKLTATADQLPELTSRAAELDVLDRFDFIGTRSVADVRALLADATAAVIPSLLESFGLTYLEAMGVGTPVIAADVPFAREACGEVALYCSPHIGQEFGEAVLQILQSPGLAKGISQAGQERFRSTAVSWSMIADAYLELIGSL